MSRVFEALCAHLKTHPETEVQDAVKFLYQASFGGGHFLSDPDGAYLYLLKEAETADTYIERATYELRRERRVRVATSDGPKQIIILGHGALRVSARAFHAEVEAAEGQISAVLQRLTNRPRSERTIRNNVKLKQ